MCKKNEKLSLDSLNRISVQEFKNAEKYPLIVVLDNIRSMNNVGSIFRSSDAFLIQEIFLCGITPQPPHREINKTALGSTQSVAWRYFSSTMDAINLLKDEGYLICSIEQATNSIPLQEFKVENNQKIAIILGNEVEGVEQKIVDSSNCVIEITQYGTKHSLNVSVTAGIVLWHIQNEILSQK
ncbi:MAG: RNA methyltransferase [Bacteroidales bacterium]|jgi:tRNA G18 (ribose-2'-O)-methylase SpoU|nr:RNA methyltransferase [Bacteroidales bacterium]